VVTFWGCIISEMDDIIEFRVLNTDSKMDFTEVDFKTVNWVELA
jgi:hypothetical protein